MENNKIDDIQEKMFISKLEEEAKKVPRNELEGLYVDMCYTDNIDQKQTSKWVVISVIFFIATLVLILFIYSIGDNYANSEFVNYNSFARDVCEHNELGNLRYFTINRDFIIVKCYGGDYHLPVIK